MSTNENETPRQRLERMREEAARRRQASAEAASAALPVAPGDEIHVLKTGVSIPTGGGYAASAHTSRAGETICLTAAMIAASYSASGRSWLAIIDDEASQVERWGEVRFRIGRAPEGTPTWGEVGDSDWRQARDDARAEAWNMPTAEARAAAIAAVNARFGPIASTATYSKYTDPSIALAEAQQHALNTGGVRFSQHVEAKEAGARR